MSAKSKSKAAEAKERKPAAPTGRKAPAKSGARGRSPKPKGGSARLRPGELDGLVIAYMRDHGAERPFSPGKVAKGIGKSSGAVANCLERLAGSKEIRRVRKKPRTYDLKGPSGRS
jgi:hypothetical protein